MIILGLGILSQHLPAVERIEHKVRQEEFRLEEHERQAVLIIQLLHQLEATIIKNFGQKLGEKLVKEVLIHHWQYINSRISMNDFEAVTEELHKVMNEVRNHAEETMGASVH